MSLSGKKIVLGVTGSIAAYKACDIIQLLKDRGACVRVVMTPAAAKFLSPLTFQALTGSPVATGPFDTDSSKGMPHIGLAEWAELFLIAPCTANTASELAQGATRSLVSLLYLSFKGPVFIAPAMNSSMLNSPSVRENLAILKRHGAHVLPSGWGKMACDDVGYGKMLDAESLVKYLHSASAFPDRPPSLAGVKCLVVLGHTEEPLDAVRFLSNQSSGKTGFALARALTLCGAEVSLVCGKTDTSPSNQWHGGPHCRYVKTTADFYRETLTAAEQYDVILHTAALADFVPLKKSTVKIKGSSSLHSLELKPAVNVLGALATKRRPGQILVAFALENRGKESAGLKKIKDTGIDMLIVNSVENRQKTAGFGLENIRACIVLPTDMGKKLPPLKTISKSNLAASICLKLYNILKIK